MENLLGFLTLFCLDILLYGIFYVTGWVILKILTFGKLAIAPRRKRIWNASLPQAAYHPQLRWEISDRSTTVVGLLFWVALGVIFAFVI